jgi:hypothetical protein
LDRATDATSDCARGVTNDRYSARSTPRPLKAFSEELSSSGHEASFLDSKEAERGGLPAAVS